MQTLSSEAKYNSLQGKKMAGCPLTSLQRLKAERQRRDFRESNRARPRASGLRLGLRQGSGPDMLGTADLGRLPQGSHEGLGDTSGK